MNEYSISVISSSVGQICSAVCVGNNAFEAFEYGIRTGALFSYQDNNEYYAVVEIGNGVVIKIDFGTM